MIYLPSLYQSTASVAQECSFKNAINSMSEFIQVGLTYKNLSLCMTSTVGQLHYKNHEFAMSCFKNLTDNTTALLENSHFTTLGYISGAAIASYAIYKSIFTK